MCRTVLQSQSCTTQFVLQSVRMLRECKLAKCRRTSASEHLLRGTRHISLLPILNVPGSHWHAFVRWCSSHDSHKPLGGPHRVNIRSTLRTNIKMTKQLRSRVESETRRLPADLLNNSAILHTLRSIPLPNVYSSAHENMD